VLFAGSCACSCTCLFSMLQTQRNEAACVMHHLYSLCSAEVCISSIKLKLITNTGPHSSVEVQLA
jgi:hypothetical protein